MSLGKSMGKARILGSSFAFGLGPKKQSFSNAAPTNAFSCQFFVIDTKSLCKETHTLNVLRKASHGISV